ncbi:MAG: hypothetical protein KDC73_03930 [Ignavibacteriae bacterium]|nr:hypothetical protein [Ignavibacteriota bacterium]MCB0723825.1 hypothetical protein [Ignavibacteriota bacterium]MCB9244130.1 hypothetical protein [Ignavibacteriales bacterium]
MNTLNIIWGSLSILGMIFGFIPCFGAFNWINIPFAGVGVILGIVGIAVEKGNKNGSIAGLIMCLVAALFGAVRLLMGGGVV